MSRGDREDDELIFAEAELPPRITTTLTPRHRIEWERDDDAPVVGDPTSAEHERCARGSNAHHRVGRAGAEPEDVVAVVDQDGGGSEVGIPERRNRHGVVRVDVQHDDVERARKSGELADPSRRRRGRDRVHAPFACEHERLGWLEVTLFGESDRMAARSIEAHPPLGKPGVTANRMREGQHVQHPPTLAHLRSRRKVGEQPPTGRLQAAFDRYAREDPWVMHARPVACRSCYLEHAGIVVRGRPPLHLPLECREHSAIALHRPVAVGGGELVWARVERRRVETFERDSEDGLEQARTALGFELTESRGERRLHALHALLLQALARHVCRRSIARAPRAVRERLRARHQLLPHSCRGTKADVPGSVR